MFSCKGDRRQQNPNCLLIVQGFLTGKSPAVFNEKSQTIFKLGPGLGKVGPKSGSALYLYACVGNRVCLQCCPAAVGAFPGGCTHREVFAVLQKSDRARQGQFKARTNVFSLCPRCRCPHVRAAVSLCEPSPGEGANVPRPRLREGDWCIPGDFHIALHLGHVSAFSASQERGISVEITNPSRAPHRNPKLPL